MKSYKLSNGLRAVVETIPAFRSVSFGIWIKTGSRTESSGNNGISHFIEHMLFKGTERYTAKDIAEIFDEIGGNVNAYTSKEYTCFYFKVLDIHLTKALDVLSEMIFRSNLYEHEMEKEKKVIYEEIAMYEDTPDDLVHDLIAQAAFGSHPLAYPILGTEATLAGMKPDDLRSYMDAYYDVDNMVISIAGNIDDRIVELLEMYFSPPVKRGAANIIAEPQFHAGQIFNRKKTEQNHICLSLPGLSITDDHLYAMVILNNVVGGGMSSRLFQEIRENRGLAYSVYSYHSAYSDSGLFTIYTGTAPQQTSEVLDLTLELLNAIRVHGITDHELHKAKEQLKGGLILSSESTSSRMNRLGKNELMLGKQETLEDVIVEIDAVSHEHIHEVTQIMFSTPFAIAMVGDSDKAINKIKGEMG